ncbi:MAG: YaiI/YqxD family protein [Bacillota bacterium]
MVGDKIRILVDGDSCPVIANVEKIAKEYNVAVLVFVDYDHELDLNYAELIKMDTENQSVDMEIVNRASSKDIIITQDYGLAALVLAKDVYVLNFYGKRYTNKNIDSLLMRRHHNAKMRRAGKSHPNHSKRTKEDDKKFEDGLVEIIKES